MTFAPELDELPPFSPAVDVDNDGGRRAPTLLERGRASRDFVLRDSYGLDVEHFRRELEDDPAAALLGCALDVPRRVGRLLRRPPSLGLLLLALAVRRAVA